MKGRTAERNGYKEKKRQEGDERESEKRCTKSEKAIGRACEK